MHTVFYADLTEAEQLEQAEVARLAAEDEADRVATGTKLSTSGTGKGKGSCKGRKRKVAGEVGV